MFKKVIIATATVGVALLGAAGVAYADSNDHANDVNLDNGANHQIDTGHVLGFLSL